MKIYIVVEYAEEGMFSTPLIEVHVFSTEEARDKFLEEWVHRQEECDHERDDEDPYTFYGHKDWIYWLGIEEGELK